MRRNIAWMTATVALVALLIGYEFAYAGTRSDDRDTNRACATATTSATTCQPTDTNRTGGDTSAHVAKPGENK